MKNLIKISFVLAAFVECLNVSALEEQISFGVKGGVNLSNFGGDVEDLDSKIGFNVGLTLAGINIPSTNLQSKQSNQSQKGSANEVNSKNADSRTYSNYETQLIKMNTNYERDYNDSTRKDIQRKMKSIRQKWVDRGYNMYKSTWEDWNGVKR